MPKVDIIIDLSQLAEPIEVSHAMRRAKIYSYTYAFVTDEGIIKIGESADGSKTPGERIYRQAGHLPGWPTRPKSSSGADMITIAQDFQNKYNRILHKDTVKIMIYQVGNKEEAVDLERSLINEIIQFCGRAPLGNRDSKTKTQQKALTNQAKLNEFVDFS
jgi:hypothetical protein